MMRVESLAVKGLLVKNALVHCGLCMYVCVYVCVCVCVCVHACICVRKRRADTHTHSLKTMKISYICTYMDVFHTF
jgi:hypothetical protein